MKEITRIHIAKVAYDIELNAKKELENYIVALERYAGDKELLDDIEIRITELLAERGVQADGVISSDDVVAVRAQLGEPSDFAPEDEAAVQELNDEPRRVYRDEEGAVLGGVLAGFARFFGVDPLWIRIVFIILLFASFGAALLVYLIFWLIIPPARTAAEKLRMNGKLVTLASIKALGEKAEPSVSGTAKVMRRLLRIGTGLVLVAGSVAALGAVAIAVAHLFLGAKYEDLEFARITSGEIWWIVAGLGLFPLAGLLLSALCIVLANAAFRSIWNRRTSTAVIAIIAAGLITFAGGVGAVVYGQLSMQARANENRQTTSVTLPANFMAIKTLHVLGDSSDIGMGNTDITVSYTVSDSPRYELIAPSEVKPEFVIADDGLSATATITKNNSNVWRQGYRGLSELHIYGPALTGVVTEASSPYIRYSASKPQGMLSMTARGAGIELLGSYSDVSVINNEGATIALDRATITNLVIDGKNGAVEAGVVWTLTVTVPDACPVASTFDGLNVSAHALAVSGNEITFNGDKLPAKTIKTDCGKVVIGNDEEQ